MDQYQLKTDDGTDHDGIRAISEIYARLAAEAGREFGWTIIQRGDMVFVPATAPMPVWQRVYDTAKGV